MGGPAFRGTPVCLSQASFLAAMYRYGVGGLTEDAVQNATQQLVHEGRLVPARLHDEEAFTTDKNLNAEKEMLAILNASQGQGQPLMQAEQVQDRLAQTRLTDGQKGAVETILSHKDSIVGVQGYAGSGKTTMLREMRTLAGEGRAIGLAPSASAARTLEQESGIKSQTLRLLNTGPSAVRRAELNQQASADKILVVDEASLASTRQMLICCASPGLAPRSGAGGRYQTAGCG